MKEEIPKDLAEIEKSLAEALKCSDAIFLSSFPFWLSDQLSKMIWDTQVKVEKEILDSEYVDVELNLNLRDKKYVEMLNVQPDHAAWRSVKRASPPSWETRTCKNCMF